MVRVVAFGGRDFTDAEWLNHVLDRVHSHCGISTLIHGDALGADTLAKKWAICAGVPQLPFPANWKWGQPQVGFARNTRMIQVGKPELGIGFPGGPGTRDMKAQLEAAGIEVITPALLYKVPHGTIEALPR